MSLTTFHDFFNLPKELRDVIYNLSCEPRVTSIDERMYIHEEKDTHRWCEPDSKNPRSVVIKESFPTLLHVCYESREFMLAKYASVFRQSTIPWIYRGSRKLGDLRKVWSMMHPPQQGTVSEMIESINTFMNKNPTPHLPKPKRRDALRVYDIYHHPYLKFARMAKIQYHPFWFDPHSDIFIWKTRPRGARSLPPWLCQGVNPFVGGCLNVHHLAIEFDRLTTWGYNRFLRGAPQREGILGAGRHVPPDGEERVLSAMIEDFARRYYECQTPALKILTLISQFESEVYNFRLEDLIAFKDRKDGVEPLKDDEWTFSLDAHSQDFKSELGGNWTNVTWNITLPNTGADLWKRVMPPSGWCAKQINWERQKQAAVKGVDEVNLKWFASREFDRWHAKRMLVNGEISLHDKILIPRGGVDSKIYMGPLPRIEGV